MTALDLVAALMDGIERAAEAARIDDQRANKEKEIIMAEKKTDAKVAPEKTIEKFVAPKKTKLPKELKAWGALTSDQWQEFRTSNPFHFRRIANHALGELPMTENQIEAAIGVLSKRHPELAPEVPEAAPETAE